MGEGMRGRSTAQQAMVRVMRVAGRIEQALADVCSGYGITPDQYNVLRILRGAQPEGYPRYEIAERLIRRAPDVTRLLDRLELQGLIERVRSAEDRRLSLSRITRQGLELLEQVDPEVVAVHDLMAAPLSAEQLRDLGRMCDAMLA